MGNWYLLKTKSLKIRRFKIRRTLVGGRTILLRDSPDPNVYWWSVNRLHTPNTHQYNCSKLILIRELFVNDCTIVIIFTNDQKSFSHLKTISIHQLFMSRNCSSLLLDFIVYFFFCFVCHYVYFIDIIFYVGRQFTNCIFYKL